MVDEVMPKYRILGLFKDGKPYGFRIEEWLPLYYSKLTGRPRNYYWQTYPHWTFETLEGAESHIEYMLAPKPVYTQKEIKTYG